jgi:hypothetical protein
MHMTEPEDFRRLDDPAFLAARGRVREELERARDGKVSTELNARYHAMNLEFRRRACMIRAGEAVAASSVLPFACA